jgi:large subunit ribosomal protein L13
MIHTIDAKNSKIGKIASQAAALLIGKNTPTFRKNIVQEVTVKIVNVSQADINEKKKDEKKYVNYSGYPGGLKTLSLGAIAAKKGYKEIFRTAVYGMLPHNKLRSKMIKNLIITE